MYNSFKIKNFRCFEELEIENIQRVNLITGLNNIGKTALLEALFLYGSAPNPQIATNRINIFRGFGDGMSLKMSQAASLLWANLFFGLDISRNVEMEGINDKGEKRSLRFRMLPQNFTSLEIAEGQNASVISRESAEYGGLEYECEDTEGIRKYRLFINPQGIYVEPSPLPQLFPEYFLAARRYISSSEEADLFSNLEIKNQQDLLINTLKLIEPKLQRIALITRAGQPMLHGDIGGSELMPLHVMGDGMVRICSIILAIANAPNGMVLIDEVENGLHHSVLKKLWTAIGDIARQLNTQVFATTHSYECLSAAHQAFSENSPYDFALYRLGMIKEKIKVIAYDQESLESTIETGWEVR
ncbi:AAA family ATPase [bacterium]|nr:AAA family ATPase [bacterium]MBU1753564.1 AAA family ATPase [bacterium]